MPHDVNGQPLSEGDLVNVPCRVMSIHEGESYCNVTLETVHTMPPYESGSSITVNSKQVFLLESPSTFGSVNEQSV